jgi:hypothetical protein
MQKHTSVGGVLAILVSFAGFGAACGDESSLSAADQSALRNAQAEEAAAGEGGDEDVTGEGFVPGEGELPPDFCEHDGAIGRIDVTFDCDSIIIISCKDLSNVVLEFEDGTRQKFDGLSGQSATFSGTGANAGKTVVGVWVKAGANHSGDGPGYGDRFDAPGEMACDDSPPGGDGDGDDDLCGEDLDEDCGTDPPGDGDGDGDTGGDGDGDTGGDGDGDTGGDGDGDDDVPCDGLDEDCGGEPPPPPTCFADPSIPCDAI